MLAGVFEIGWAMGLTSSDGVTKPLPTAAGIPGVIAFFWLISLGTACAVWVGIGRVSTAVMAVILLGDPVKSLRIGAFYGS